MGRIQPTLLLLLLLLLLFPLPLEYPLMNPVSDPQFFPLKLTEDQLRWLENTAKFIEHETGCSVSLHSVILRLMECGVKPFEKELEDLRARSNAERNKRFPRLQLAYSRVEPARLKPQ